MKSTELKDTTYEIFIAAVSVLSIVNLVAIIVAPESPFAETAVLIGYLLTAVFLFDFAFRLFTAASKARYFFREFGWLDLLSSVPIAQLKILRVSRIYRAWRLMAPIGPRNILRRFIANRADSALLTLTFLIILVLEFGGYLMFLLESQSPDSNIGSAGDALWYTFVTITTVGYGDRFPVTGGGRLIGCVIMLAGVGLFGTFTGYLANSFLSPSKKDDAGPEAAAESVPATSSTESAPVAAAVGGSAAAASVAMPIAGAVAADALDPGLALADLRQLAAEARSWQLSLDTRISRLEAALSGTPTRAGESADEGAGEAAPGADGPSFGTAAPGDLDGPGVPAAAPRVFIPGVSHRSRPAWAG